MAADPIAVPLLVERRASRGSPQPVTLGVPLPRAAVTDPSSLVLLDPDEQPVLLQTQPLAHWPDGSMKWVLLDFVLLPESTDGRWHLRRYGDGARINLPRTGALSLKGDGTLVTGPAEFGFSLTNPLPLGAVSVRWEDDSQPCRVLHDDPGFLNFVSGGTLLLPQVEEPLTWKEQGPVRGTVVESWFFLGGMFWERVRARLVTRLDFFAGTGLVRITITVGNPSAAAHRRGLWDLGDIGSLLFSELRAGISVFPRKPTQL